MAAGLAGVGVSLLPTLLQPAARSSTVRRSVGKQRLPKEDVFKDDVVMEGEPHQMAYQACRKRV
jgi:hypothetical protein